MRSVPAIPHLEAIRSIAAPIATLVLAVLLGVVYFGNRGANQSLREAHTHFYSRFSPGWLRFTEGELRHAAVSGQPSDMDLLVLRAALSRWRLREQSPIPFDNIMTWYGQGLWHAPPRETWESVFGELDAQWIRARQDHLEHEGEPPPSVDIEAGAGSLLLRFPAPRPTSALGSLLVVEVDVEGLRAEPDFVAYWQTTQATGRSAFRARRGEVHLRQGAAPGWQRLEVGFDLSWEPGWIAPGMEATAIEIFSQVLAEDGLRSVRFEDSPLLPTPGNGDGRGGR